MVRITLKQIKLELEKLKTLDDKQKHLETIIKKIKSEKLKAKLQKLLAEVLKHLEHEAKLTAETQLEEKLTPIKESSEEITSGRPLPEIKYFSRRGQSEQSALEREVAKQSFFGPSAATIGVKYEPPSRSYEHQQRVESLRFYLSEQQQLVNKFTPETWQTMAEEKRKQIFGVVQQSLGLAEVSGAEDYSRVINYISDVFSSGKPSEKYKTRV